MNTQLLARDSTLDVELSGFRDVIDGTYPQGATGTLVLLKPDGSTLVSGITLTRDVATSGAATIYRGAIPYEIALLPNTTYEAVLTMVVGSNRRTFRMSCSVPE